MALRKKNNKRQHRCGRLRRRPHRRQRRLHFRIIHYTHQ